MSSSNAIQHFRASFCHALHFVSTTGWTSNSYAWLFGRWHACCWYAYEVEQIELRINGNPAPQGSKKIIHGRLIEASSQKLRIWRKAIEIACHNYKNQNIMLGPVEVEAHFFLPRPASVSHAKRPFPIVPPDLDKLARGLLDGIGQSGTIWGDDSQVVKLVAYKSYADQNNAGAIVTIRQL